MLQLLLALIVSATAAAQSGTPAPVASHAPSNPRPAAVEVARVDGAVITSDRLEIAVNELIPLEAFHRAVSPERMLELRRKALDNLVDAQLALADAARRHVVVTEADIDQGLARTIKQYKTRQAFDEARAQSHQSIDDIRREIRRALLIENAYQRAVFQPCQVPPTEAARYFKEHPERFVVPEALHIEAITIGLDPTATPAEREEARALANRVLGELKDGGRFGDLARRYSTDKKSRDAGGDMGLVHRGSLSDAFETATQGLSVGDISGVVETIYGFHIVRLADTRAPRPQQYAEVAVTLRKDLTSKRCGEVYDQWLAGLRARASIVVADPALAARPATAQP